MVTLSKTIHFICGMPRSGSTILGNILAQNPRFHVTPTSALIDLLAGMRSAFDKIPDFRAALDEDAKMGAIHVCPVRYSSSHAFPNQRLKGSGNVLVTMQPRVNALTLIKTKRFVKGFLRVPHRQYCRCLVS